MVSGRICLSHVSLAIAPRRCLSGRRCPCVSHRLLVRLCHSVPPSSSPQRPERVAAALCCQLAAHSAVFCRSALECLASAEAGARDRCEGAPGAGLREAEAEAVVEAALLAPGGTWGVREMGWHVTRLRAEMRHVVHAHEGTRCQMSRLAALIWQDQADPHPHPRLHSEVRLLWPRCPGAGGGGRPGRGTHACGGRGEGAAGGRNGVPGAAAAASAAGRGHRRRSRCVRGCQGRLRRPDRHSSPRYGHLTCTCAGLGG